MTDGKSPRVLPAVIEVAPIIVLNLLATLSLLIQTAYSTVNILPSVNDLALDVKVAVTGLSSPTSMAFLDNDDIIVLEKDGQVRLVRNGILQEQPILITSVNAESERGLLGIAIQNDTNDAANPLSNVFLYYTEGEPMKNRVYKYQWNGYNLVNQTLILDLPAKPGPNHNGGKIVIGPDGYLYVTVGDVNRYGQLENNPNGLPPDGTGSIIRVDPEDGSAPLDNPFVNSGNVLLYKYYAYGIRNSFGIDFDPVTGNLWDTENGPDSYDEINLVIPGFNSGWFAIWGPLSARGLSEAEGLDLVHFAGSEYVDPLLSWTDPVGPTDIEFYRSSMLGSQYANNIFVGDFRKGNLYFFEINETRDGIKLNDSHVEVGLTDLVVDTKAELSSITFGTGFRGITDIETGHNGFLYVLSYNDGALYEISPSDMSSPKFN